MALRHDFNGEAIVGSADFSSISVTCLRTKAGALSFHVS
jgi:hypothetical protein